MTGAAARQRLGALARGAAAAAIALLGTGWAAPASAERALDAVPLHYQLTVTPDFGTSTFEGDLTIDLRVEKATTRIVLDAVDLDIYDAEITLAPDRRVRPGRTVDAASGTVTFTTATRMLPGTIKLRIEYGGHLRTDGRGFYQVRAYGRKYLLSQMESTDARRAFPCVDDPSVKASFALSAVVDERLVGISNGKLISDTPSPARTGRHVLRFGTTPRMSTYLVALEVGEFECREGAADGIPVRVCAAPEHRNDLAFALEAAVRSLRFDSQYFTFKYPFRKLDLVAVPGHFPGAMENSGAIVFDEGLLVSADTASEAELEQTAETISHEIAHQWLGDIVTPRWWDDLWLSEGMATWLAPKALAAWKPAWHAELSTLEKAHEAMALDAFRSTRSVRAPVATEAEIEEAFDAMAYGKAGAVIAMIEAWVGPEAFRNGINAYVRAHAYQGVSGEDLWTAIAAAAEKPVDQVMPGFITKPGVPLVTVESACDADETVVTLTVRRLGGGLPAGDAAAAWSIPVNLRGLNPTSAMTASAWHLVTEPRQSIRIGGCFQAVWVDSGATGYFRSAYTPDSLAVIARLAPSRLTPAERLRLLDNEWAIVSSGADTIGSFLSLARALAADQVPDILEALGSRLRFVADNLATGPAKDAFAAWVRATFGPAARSMGWQPAWTESDDRRRLRAALFDIDGGPGRDPALLGAARAYVAGHTPEQPTLDRSLVPVASRLAASSAGDVLWETLRARDTEAALASAGSPALVTKTLERALLDGHVREALPSWVAAALGNPAVNAAAWTFVKTRWADLQPMLSGAFGLTGIVSAAGSFCDADARSDVERFFQDKTSSMPRTLALALERIDACRDVRLRQDAALSAWLRTQGR